jgi:hypothetical protein
VIVKRLVCAFALTLAVISGAAAQAERREFKTLIWNNSHVVSYEKRGTRLVIRMEMIGDFTEDRKPARYQEMDFASFRVDLNNNNQVDRRLDIAFGQRSSTDILCTQYLHDRVSSSGCGALPSRAGLKISFAKSPFFDTAHPVFEFSVPISELERHSKTIGFEFLFHSKGAGFTFYPATASVYKSFKETLKLDLGQL